MAAALMGRRARLSGAALWVASAGFQTSGESSPDETVQVMRGFGIDLTSHHSTQVTEAQIRAADLVLGMTRRHVWDAALLESGAITRAFVIGEVPRLNRLIGGRSPGEPFTEWVERLHDGRHHTLGSVVDADEVPDPFRRRRRVHERVANLLERFILELADCAFDPVIPNSERRWREGRLIWRLPET